ncbi:hypothetical protein [Dethiosulfatarculus sandiegensis]|nr:hypothetical protein [Dethiosulfatarculus sandiegensis]
MELTVRQTIKKLLQTRAMTSLDLSLHLEIPFREIEQHLEHIKHSEGKRLIVRPAECRDCGFVFKTRKRLNCPGRCPECRGHRIKGPLFELFS